MVNAVVQADTIDYLYNIRITFEGKPIRALIDTSSTSTVIS